MAPAMAFANPINATPDSSSDYAATSTMTSTARPTMMSADVLTTITGVVESTGKVVLPNERSLGLLMLTWAVFYGPDVVFITP